MGKLLILFFILFIISMRICAQEIIIDIPETAPLPVSAKPKGIVNKIISLFTNTDTTYVYPNKYNLTLMLENSNWYEYYRFKNITEEDAKTLFISPKMNYKLGGYIGWKFLFIGYSFDVRDIFSNRKNKDQRTEFGLSLYSAAIGCDLYYRKSGNAFKLRNIHDYDPHATSKDINGFSVDIKGINAYWIFNNKKFSYPAAYSQTTNQRRNAGSLIAGISYSEHNIDFDRSKLPSKVVEQLGDAFNFRKINYRDFGINIGYSYNWVFAKNWLGNLSLTPAIAYKHSKISGEEAGYPTKNNINFDFITRAGVTYNNSKYFIGASLVMHTYDYQSDNFYLNNSFGTIRIYAGFNFWKKKEYKD